MSSTGALSLKQVPEKLGVIGAGVIGVDLVNKLIINHFIVCYVTVLLGHIVGPARVSVCLSVCLSVQCQHGNLETTGREKLQLV